MFIASLVVAVIAIVAILIGIILWHTNHNVVTTLLIGVGAITLFFIPPWLAQNVTEPNWYGDIMWFIRDWGWVILGLACVLVFIDGIFGIMNDWSVNRYGIPLRAAGTGMQTQASVFCFVIAAVLLGLTLGSGIPAIERMTAPNVDPKYVELKEELETSQRCLGDLKFVTYDPLTFEIDATTLQDVEIQRWIAKLETEFNTNEGGTLKADKIHKIQVRMSNGKEIDKYIIGFDGKIDNPDPAEDTVLKGKTYPIRNALDYAASMKWVDDEFQKCDGTFQQPAAGTTPSPSSSTTASSTTFFEPPKTCPLGTM